MTSPLRILKFAISNRINNGRVIPNNKKKSASLRSQNALRLETFLESLNRIN